MLAGVAASNCVCGHFYLRMLAAYGCHRIRTCIVLLGSPHKLCICLVTWASLREPHLVSCMAGGGIGMYVCMYVCMYVTVRSTIKLFAVCPLQVCTVRKWLSLMSRSNFPFGALPVSIISSETKAAVLPFPSSLIYAVKSERQVTTVVVRFIRCNVRQVSVAYSTHRHPMFYFTMASVFAILASM